MGVLWCGLCGLLVGAGALAATGGIRDGKDRVLFRLPIVRRRLWRLLSLTGASRVSVRLRAWGPFALCAEELSRACAERGTELCEANASALLIYGACGVAALGWLVAGSLVGGMVALAMLVAGMAWHMSAAERKRRLDIAREMPAVFRTLATALASGQTLVQALDYVGLHEDGHAAEAFARASLRLRCGMSADQALLSLREELDAPGVGLMACALIISQRTGSPLRDLFRRSAALAERQGDLERMLSVRTAQVRLSVRVVCGLPPLMVCLLATISPDYRQGLASAAGIACLGLAIALDGIALLCIRKIMRGVLV